jgi:hypothetical protein
MSAALLADHPADIVGDDRRLVDQAMVCTPDGDETATVAEWSDDAEVVRLAATLLKAVREVETLLELCRLGVGVGDAVADHVAVAVPDPVRNDLDDLLDRCDDAQLKELCSIPEFDLWWLRQDALRSAGQLAEVAGLIDARLVEAAAAR